MRPARPSSKLPLLLAGLLGLLVVLGLGTGVILLTRWVRSEECRALLESKVSETLGVKTEVGPLEWLWIGVSSPRFKAVSGEGNQSRELEAGNVRARLKTSSLLQGIWAVEEIAIEKTRLHFSPLPPDSASSTLATTPPDKAKSPAHLPSWVPSVVVVEAVRSGHTDLLFDLPNGRGLEVQDTRMELYPEKSGYRMEAHGGTMIWSLFPGIHADILWARGRIVDGRLSLNGAELSFPGGGSSMIEGEFPDSEGVSRISSRTQGVPLGTLFPMARDSISGLVSWEGGSSWRGPELLSLKGHVSVEEASIHGVPALDTLASFTGMEQFRNLALHKASASFEKKGSTTLWSDIDLETPGLIKVIGTARVGDDGSLSGTFQAGITTDIVRVIPMARELLSAEERDGYFWMPVNVGGTLSKPTEDLQPRLLTAVATKASGVIREGIDVGLKALGLLPGTNAPSATATNASPSLEKDAHSVIDALGGFLK